MAHGSLSVPEFSRRLNENGDVTKEWPFADIVAHEKLRTDIGTDFAERDGLAVGRLVFLYGDAGTFRVHDETGALPW
jgi:hypothetical protein